MPPKTPLELIELLSGEPASVPTGRFGRIRRIAGAAFRSRRVFLHGGEEIDPKVIERLVRSFGELKGVAMKMGQIMSYIDDAMPAESRALLGVLRTWSPPTEFMEISNILREDLPEQAAIIFETLTPEPVASASIGQVHRARLPDGTCVAVKVRHPGIDEAIKADFSAAKMGNLMAKLMAPGVDLPQFINEARTAFLEECDYLLEARRQQRFVDLYSNSQEICIPAVHQIWCGPRVLTTTWWEGDTFDQLVESDPSEASRARLGAALYDFYVGTLYRHGLFNADPHPGNLLFPDDSRVVVLDHGCVREFEPETVRAVASLSVAVREDDQHRVREALERLGAKDPGTGKRYQVTRELLRSFYGPTLESGAHRPSGDKPSSMRSMVRAKRNMMNMHLPGKLMFLLRIRFGLYALLARLGSTLDLRTIESQLTEEVLS